MNGLWIGLAGAVGGPLVMFLFQLFLKRERVQAWGRQTGAFCRVFLGQRAKVVGGTKVVERMVSTVADFVDGVAQGLAG